MATIALAWELGGGLGHIALLAPLAKELTSRGHEVWAILRHLSKAEAVFGRDTARFLQAPFRGHADSRDVRVPLTYAHVLHNAGYYDAGELRALAGGWRQLLEFIQPHLLVADHSPTALLASRGLPMRRAVIGFGFICPPDQSPLPCLRPWMNVDGEALLRDELEIRARMNEVIGDFGQPPLARVSEIYGDADRTVLTTYPELDHFGPRASTPYYGDHCEVAGKAPVWPEGKGKRIFAYLKPFPALEPMLKWLKSSGHRVIAYIDAMPRELQAQLQDAYLQFSTKPLDVRQTAAECNVAILNGGHSTTAAFLLAGKPTVQIPLYLEQGIMARTIERLGVGVEASAQHLDHLIRSVQRAIEDTEIKRRAVAFASKYQPSGKAGVAVLCNELEALL